MNLLNIGCGGHFHEAWTNIDLVSTSPHVRAYDLRKGLPYAEGTFDAVYTSHVLEHLAPGIAEQSLGEQFRVLKRGGIVRAVVPDLEDKAREYLVMLEKALQGDKTSEAHYDWMTLELLDQMVRDKVGGLMGAYILNPKLSNPDYVVRRIGDEAESWLGVAKGIKPETPHQSLLTRIRAKGAKAILQKTREKVAEVVVGIIAGSDVKSAFQEGLFRSSGELHRWMYDRFSLGRLLQQVGFTDVRVCRFDESRISQFSTYFLDNTPQNTIRKADSLFMEAVKP